MYTNNNSQFTQVLQSQGCLFDVNWSFLRQLYTKLKPITTIKGHERYFIECLQGPDMTSGTSWDSGLFMNVFHVYNQTTYYKAAFVLDENTMSRMIKESHWRRASKTTSSNAHSLPEWFFHHNSNSMANWFQYNSIIGYNITAKFCTCHCSTAVGPCVKFQSDSHIKTWMKAEQIFHRIWTTMGKLFVKWAPVSWIADNDTLAESSGPFH